MRTSARTRRGPGRGGSARQRRPQAALWAGAHGDTRCLARLCRGAAARARASAPRRGPSPSVRAQGAAPAAAGCASGGGGEAASRRGAAPSAASSLVLLGRLARSDRPRWRASTSESTRCMRDSGGPQGALSRIGKPCQHSRRAGAPRGAAKTHLTLSAGAVRCGAAAICGAGGLRAGRGRRRGMDGCVPERADVAATHAAQPGVASATAARRGRWTTSCARRAPRRRSGGRKLRRRRLQQRWRRRCGPLRAVRCRACARADARRAAGGRRLAPQGVAAAEGRAAAGRRGRSDRRGCDAVGRSLGCRRARRRGRRRRGGGGA
jgi:hypothetical protein